MLRFFLTIAFILSACKLHNLVMRYYTNTFNRKQSPPLRRRMPRATVFARNGVRRNSTTPARYAQTLLPKEADPVTNADLSMLIRTKNYAGVIAVIPPVTKRIAAPAGKV